MNRMLSFSRIWPTRKSQKARIAVCFFGITRSLRYTVSSLEENILKPAREIGEVTVHAHFFDQKSIASSRTDEYGTLDPTEHRLLTYDTLEIDEPDHCLKGDWYDAVRAGGDYWKDDFQSLRNLAHQLHSLHKVTIRALGSNPDVVVFCRPDLEYHDTLKHGLLQACATLVPTAYVPAWQAWAGGLNDRFAICAGEKAIFAYGCRRDQATNFIVRTQSPLHSEKLVRFALMEAGILVRRLDVRASRVRLGGHLKSEDFSVRWRKQWRQSREFIRLVKQTRRP